MCDGSLYLKNQNLWKIQNMKNYAQIVPIYAHFSELYEKLA